MSDRSDHPRKPMPLGFKIPLIAIPILTLIVLTPVFVPAARFALFAILGRNYQCSFAQALHSPAFGDDRKRRIVEITASAQHLATDGNYSLWRTRDGDFWIPNRNAETLIFNLAEQEQDIYGQGAVHAGDVVLDGGANIGVFTRKALNAGARTVIAVEPAPENVESLRRNFAKEIASGRVVLQAVGLWNQAAELPLRVDGANSARNSFVLDEGATTSTVVVPLVTIDSLVAKLAPTSVDFIKLDIEGAEKNAIAGATQTIARFHPRLAVAMEHLVDDPIAIPAAINAMGLGYVTVCGPCVDYLYSVRPDSLYFQPLARGK